MAKTASAANAEADMRPRLTPLRKSEVENPTVATAAFSRNAAVENPGFGTAEAEDDDDSLAVSDDSCVVSALATVAAAAVVVVFDRLEGALVDDCLRAAFKNRGAPLLRVV